MKKLFWLLPLTIILYACPFESNVALESQPVEPVDTSLCGYWYGIVKDGSDFFGIEALDIKKESDSIYNIVRYGKAIKGDIILPDTAYFTGYTSYVNDEKYMNVIANIIITERDKKNKVQVKSQRVYYMARIQKSNDTLSVKTITENFSKKKSFASPEELRQMVTKEESAGKNIYDDQYSLRYRKIPKPEKLF
jgi:hypothetical protein